MDIPAPFSPQILMQFAIAIPRYIMLGNIYTDAHSIAATLVNYLVALFSHQCVYVLQIYFAEGRYLYLYSRYRVNLCDMGEYSPVDAFRFYATL